MLKSSLSVIAVAALSAGMVFVATDIATAQKAKKLTYEEAYEKCRTVDMFGFKRADTGPDVGGRYSRGASCMKKYGYRLKQGDQ